MTNNIVKNNFFYHMCHGGFLDGSAGEETACKAGGMGSNLGSGRSLGEGMATHSSLLAWKVLRAEEPHRLQSTGQRVERE